MPLLVHNDATAAVLPLVEGAQTYSIFGRTTISLVPQASVVISFYLDAQGVTNIYPEATSLTFTPSGGNVYSIAGSVSLSLVVEASMRQTYRDFRPARTTIELTPQATRLAFNPPLDSVVYELAGGTTLEFVINAGFNYEQGPQTYAISGHVLLILYPRAFRFTTPGFSYVRDNMKEAIRNTVRNSVH